MADNFDNGVGCLVGGKEIFADERLPLFNPSTGKPWSTTATSGALAAEAIASAAQTVESRVWSSLDASDRALALWRLADLIEANAGDLARLEVFGSGKTMRAARGEMLGTARWWRYFAGAADKHMAGRVSLGSLIDADITHEPVGLVLAITPANGPVSLGTWKAAPALAMGNSVILKPPLNAPAASLLLGKLALQAGIPAGVLNIVPADGAVTAGMARNPAVNMVSFTGSTAVAKSLGAEMAGLMKRYVCEAGGKSPFIVFDDANLDHAVIAARQGIFGNSGQTCVAASRILVQDGVFDQFVARFAESARVLRVGDPFEDSTHIGPLYSSQQLTRAETILSETVKQGGKVVQGGLRSSLKGDLGEGYFFDPTILVLPSPVGAAWSDEIFGPVATIVRFRDEAEAVALANDTSYGLAAGIWTTNQARARHISSQIKAGTIWINTYRMIHFRAPFGGYKESGIGRENGMQAMLEFTNTKSIVQDFGAPADPFNY